MSENMQLEEGATEQHPPENIRGRSRFTIRAVIDTIVILFLACLGSIVIITVIVCVPILLISILVCLVIIVIIAVAVCFLILLIFIFLVRLILFVKWMLKLIQNSKKGFLLLCVIAIILDPLFFYIPVIHDERKCIELDKKLGTTATVLRFVFDFLKMIHIIFGLRTELRENGRKRSWLFFLIDILAILPIPQVLILRVRGAELLFAMITFFLLQYLLRVSRTYMLFTQATGVSGILAEAKWAIVAFNLLLYMQGGHVFGALWYFNAIGKLVGCWKNACRNHSECNHSSFYCDDNLRDYKFLNDFCSSKTGNTTNYNFGLYTDALESGIVELTDFPKKLLHCLQWGMQNLSAFGQNLQTSTDVWENIFAICMTNFGVVLFVFLIGKMQSDTERSQKIKLKWKEVTQWPPFNDLSAKVKEQVRKDKRKKWQETKRVDVDNLVNDLPEETARKIKREIGLKLLKKVKGFENWSEKSLGELCDCLKPVLFVERTRIIREGDPIDEMLFVLKGKLWTYSHTSWNTPNASVLIGRRSRQNHLEDYEFFGEELITWAQNEHSSHLPPSTKTIQALTNVEVFILMADDLKHVSLLRHYDRAALVIQSCWRFRRILREKKNAQKKSPLKLLLDKFWRMRGLNY